ncbi:hypothetical protein [Lysinibacillus sphaericus]|uniref:hypothetical protein n=1 Tax=Lysinibacillus sphaericus TaxID=1421 RepID=UPI0018CD8C5F|nr:hypothetical protein [Lysinibacillus sphaericus]
MHEKKGGFLLNTPKFSCRGKARREEIVKQYNLKIIAHTKLLNGQSKKSSAGGECTDEYYTFQYENKNQAKKYDNGTFLCGYAAAEHFMALTNLEDIPLFNPLLGISSSNTTESSSGGIAPPRDDMKWNPIAEQFHNAINLIIVCWNTPIYGKLARYKADVMKYYYNYPADWKIESLNDVIGKDKKNRTLTKMVEDLRIDNPTLKHFSFDLLEAKLSAMDIKSNF